MSWRDRHLRFEAALGPNWRSRILGLAAIGLAFPLILAGIALMLWEPSRVIAIGLFGQAVALIASGIGLFLMQEESIETPGHRRNAEKIEALEAELRHLRAGPSTESDEEPTRSAPAS